VCKIIAMTSHASRANAVLYAVAAALSECPDGLTLRELSRRSNVKLSLLRYHLDRELAPYVQDTRVGPDEKPFIRLIRLKPNALSHANMKLQSIIRDVDRR